VELGVPRERGGGGQRVATEMAEQRSRESSVGEVECPVDDRHGESRADVS